MMQPFLIDSHAHVYLAEFAEDLEATITNAQQQGVKEIYLPAIDSSTHERMLQTEARFPVCKCMMGLHPCSVKEDFEKELDGIKEHLAKRNFIAIGEIGLDF